MEIDTTSSWRQRAGLASLELDAGGLRRAGTAMLALGVTLPVLPHAPGLPCPLRTLTGVPCPFCGMTTAVEAGLAGRLSDAVRANPFGLVAIIVALALLARPRIRWLRVPVWLVAAGLGASWAWQLHRFGFA